MIRILFSIVLGIFFFVSLGKAQKSIDFDGINDIMTVSGYKGITGTASRSIEGWIKMATSSTDCPIVYWGINSASQKWVFRTQTTSGTVSGNIRVECNGGYITGSTDLRDNKWHHVAVTWENDGTPSITDALLYVDGVLETTNSSLSWAVNTASSLDVTFGIDQNSNQFKGSMDEFRIWSTVLSPSDIRTWMCKELNSSHPKYSSLEGYWKMDTLAGTVLKDYSTKNRNGALVNGPVWENEGGPVGVESANVYGGSSLYLTHPDGDSLHVSGLAGNPSGVHVYRRNTAPNRNGLPSGVLSYDTSRHWGVHLVNGTNSTANISYYYTSNSHYVNYGLCGIKWLKRSDNSVNNWSNSSALNLGNVLNLTSQSSGEYMLGYEAGGSGAVIASPVKKDTTQACVGDTVTLSSSTLGFQYQWLKNGALMVGDTMSSLKVTQDGNYQMIQSKGSACIDTSNTLAVLFNNHPTVTLTPFASVCISETSVPLQGGLPAGGTYLSPYKLGTDFRVQAAGVGVHKIVYVYQSQFGCGDTASQTIEVLALPNVTISTLDTTCIDSGIINLNGGNPSGGTYYVNGLGSTSFNTNTLGVGKHWVKYEYSDPTNCSNVDSMQLEIFDLPNLQLVLSKDKFCEYDAAYTPNGHSPRGGSFSGPGISAGIFNPSTAGVGKHGLVYTYREPIAGCVNQISDSVEVFPKPTTPVITANGLVLSASGSGAFQWYDKNGKIIGETNSTYTAFFNGKYKVEVTANGCRSDMSEEFDINYVGLTENVPQRVGVFPNPFNDRIRVQLNTSGDFVKYQLVSMDGRIVLQGDFSSDNSVINTSMVENGSYIFRIEQNGQKTMFPLVKQ